MYRNKNTQEEAEDDLELSLQQIGIYIKWN